MISRRHAHQSSSGHFLFFYHIIFHKNRHIAQTVAERSTCLRKKYGAIIVKNDVIVSTGYNGAPRDRKNCADLGICIRDKLQIPRGERYELCRAVHSEANAIIAASREQMLGATLYMSCVDAKTGELVCDTNCCMM